MHVRHTYYHVCTFNQFCLFISKNTISKLVQITRYLSNLLLISVINIDNKNDSPPSSASHEATPELALYYRKKKFPTDCINALGSASSSISLPSSPCTTITASNSAAHRDESLLQHPNQARPSSPALIGPKVSGEASSARQKLREKPRARKTPTAVLLGR